MPKVSVWLTSYNHEKFIAESIESILQQSYVDFELFIIDDCSTDRSWEIITKYSNMDQRIKAFRHQSNWGYSGLKSMLGELKGKYVAIAHCDDRWEKDKLKKQVELLDTCLDIEACFTLVNIIDDSGHELKNQHHPYYQVFNQPNRTRYEWLNYFFYNGNCLCHPSILIRKEAYEKCNLFTTGLQGYPDFCKWIRLCKHAGIFILQEKLTDFRVHDDESNTSGENPNSIRRLAVEEYFILDEFVDLICTNQLLKVFPELKKYEVSGEIEEYYALAKLMMSIPRYTYYLKGLQILYELFKDEDTVDKLKRLYGYTKRDYNRDKQKEDIFHRISDECMMTSSIYIDCGQGYEEKNRYICRTFVQGGGKFFIKIPAEELKRSKRKKIRFDPDEGKYRKFRDLQVFSGDRESKYKLINGERNKEDLFYTLDPQYEIECDTQEDLTIIGYTEILSVVEVEQYYASKEEHNRMLQEQFLEMKQQLNEFKSTHLWKSYEIINNIVKKLK